MIHTTALMDTGGLSHVLVVWDQNKKLFLRQNRDSIELFLIVYNVQITYQFDP
jgi:hypothetical protein